MGVEKEILTKEDVINIIYEVLKTVKIEAIDKPERKKSNALDVIEMIKELKNGTAILELINDVLKKGELSDYLKHDQRLESMKARLDNIG